MPNVPELKPELKSMPVFFIDNQNLLTEGSELIGNLVISKETPAKYPTAAMISAASVNGFDGLIVLQACTNSIVAFIFDGKTTKDLQEIREVMTKKKPSQWPSWIHMYQVNAAGLIQFLALYHTGQAGSDDMNPYTLMDLLAAKGGKEAAIIQQSLKDFCRAPEVEGVTPKEAFETVERLLLSWDD